LNKVKILYTHIMLLLSYHCRLVDCMLKVHGPTSEIQNRKTEVRFC